jgi:hypothetical protein
LTRFLFNFSIAISHDSKAAIREPITISIVPRNSVVAFFSFEWECIITLITLNGFVFIIFLFVPPGFSHAQEAAQTPEQLCEDRPPEEYFRLSTEGDCRDVVRCDRAGIAGAIRLAAVRCPAGLGFDVEQLRQT